MSDSEKSEVTSEQLMAYIDAAQVFHRTLVGHPSSPKMVHQLLALCGIHVDLEQVMDGCHSLFDRDLRRERLDLYRRIVENS